MFLLDAEELHAVVTKSPHARRIKDVKINGPASLQRFKTRPEPKAALTLVKSLTTHCPQLRSIVLPFELCHPGVKPSERFAGWQSTGANPGLLRSSFLAGTASIELRAESAIIRDTWQLFLTKDPIRTSHTVLMECKTSANNAIEDGISNEAGLSFVASSFLQAFEAGFESYTWSPGEPQGIISFDHMGPSFQEWIRGMASYHGGPGLPLRALGAGERTEDQTWLNELMTQAILKAAESIPSSEHDSVDEAGD